MKKLLVIVVLGLLLSGNAFSDDNRYKDYKDKRIVLEKELVEVKSMDDKIKVAIIVPYRDNKIQNRSEQLDKFGMEVIPVDLRDAYAFGGGLHCCTADVYRKGILKDYFPKQ